MKPRCCDYPECTAVSAGNYQDVHYCRNPKHEQYARNKVYPQGRPYRSRGWRLFQKNQHQQKGEQ